MDPLLDEKIVVSMLRNAPEFLMENFSIMAKQEAYGPSRNEGLCYESCTAIHISGDLECTLYFGLDGYTKLELLPIIADRYIDTAEESAETKRVSDTILMDFYNELASSFISEMEDGGFSLTIAEKKNLNHRLVAVDLHHNREYILIFFLTEPEKKRYLGRLYVVIAARKY